MNFKYTLLGILLIIGAACAFTISSPEPVKTVSKGEVAAFEVVLAGNANVDLSLDADIPASISERYVSVRGEEKVYVVADTDTVESGFYGIEVIADTGGTEYTLQLSVGVDQTQDSFLKLETVFDELELVQGEEAELRFLLRNLDEQPIRNIIIKSDIYKTLEPEYPNYINLQSGEEEEFVIKIYVPTDAETDEHTFTVTAAAGNIEVSKEIDISVVEKDELSDSITLKVSNAWEALNDKDENVIGYKIPFTVKNDDSLTLKDVEVVVSGVSGWEIGGDTEIDIEPVSEEEYELDIRPASFDDVTAKIQLKYDNEVIASRVVQFTGNKVGAPTGFFFMGGSIAIGILLVVIIALVVLFIRQKNLSADEVEEIKTKSYLKDLVEKAQSEKKKK